MSIPEERNLIPFPINSDFEDNEPTIDHPLGPAFAAFDEKVDLAWERFRGSPILAKTFYLASELADFSVLAATLLSERSKFKPLWYGLAGIVATSRIHVRIHHASDVIAGAIVGFGLSRVVKKFFPLTK